MGEKFNRVERNPALEAQQLAARLRVQDVMEALNIGILNP